MKSQTKQHIEPAKKKTFTIILILLPFAIIFLLELLLRLANYGGNQNLFVTGPDENITSYWMCNQNVGRRYFFMQNVRQNQPKDLFLKQKPENGYRIFVLGSSTTVGFPYSYNLMFSRILNFRLNDIFPDKYIEVVNTAMTAVNSYTLLDFMDEILEQKPDAILIYAGHNEFYGALGVASNESLGKNPSFIYGYLKLRYFKTFLVVRDAVGLIKKGVSRVTTGGSISDPSATLMSQIVADQSIPYKSEKYNAGIHQFDQNMHRIMDKAQAAHVPVILSELVSNVKDQTPFISVMTDSFPTAEQMFLSGKKLEQQGQYDLARNDLIFAKDLDALRFRASEEINDIIHNLGSEYHAPVVPMKEIFESKSEHGIIGGDLMVEHLHPNMAGYFIMADAFLNTMREHGFIEKTWDEDKIKPSHYYETTWGLTALDTVSANLNISYLKGSWPFQPKNMPNRTLEGFTPANIVESVGYQVLTQKNFSQVVGHLKLAEYYEKKEQYDAAFHEYKAAYYIIPYELDFYEGAAKALIRLNRSDEALQVLLSAQRYGHSKFMDEWIGRLLAEKADYAQARPYLERALEAKPDDIKIMQYLIVALKKAGDTEKAETLVEKFNNQMQENESKFNPQSDADKLELLYTAFMQKASQEMAEKKYFEARASYRKAHSIKQTAFTAKWIGILDLKYGDFDEAVDLMQQAAKELTEDFELHYNLCNVYIRLGRKEDAAATLQIMEKLRPGFEDPQHLREKAAAL